MAINAGHTVLSGVRSAVTFQVIRVIGLTLTPTRHTLKQANFTSTFAHFSRSVNFPQTLFSQQPNSLGKSFHECSLGLHTSGHFIRNVPLQLWDSVVNLRPHHTTHLDHHPEPQLNTSFAISVKAFPLSP